MFEQESETDFLSKIIGLSIALIFIAMVMIFGIAIFKQSASKNPVVQHVAPTPQIKQVEVVEATNLDPIEVEHTAIQALKGSGVTKLKVKAKAGYKKSHLNGRVRQLHLNIDGLDSYVGSSSPTQMTEDEEKKAMLSLVAAKFVKENGKRLYEKEQLAIAKPNLFKHPANSGGK